MYDAACICRDLNIRDPWELEERIEEIGKAMGQIKTAIARDADVIRFFDPAPETAPDADPRLRSLRRMKENEKYLKQLKQYYHESRLALQVLHDSRLWCLDINQLAQTASQCDLELCVRLLDAKNRSDRGQTMPSPDREYI